MVAFTATATPPLQANLIIFLCRMVMKLQLPCPVPQIVLETLFIIATCDG